MKKKMLTFNQLNDYGRAVFGTEDKFNGFITLGKDLMFNHQILDADGNVIDKREAEKTHRQFMLNVLGLEPNFTHRDYKRAMEDRGKQLFRIIEEEVDMKIDQGFHESEFFNQFVEERNQALDDDTVFYTEKPTLLVVSRVSGSHHDFTMQALAEQEMVQIPVSKYGAAVGTDLRLYLLGHVDWAKLTDSISQAFVRKVQNLMYAEVMNASTKLPAQFKGTGALSAATRKQFLKIKDDVSTANNGAPVMIMGTRTALRELNNLFEIDWVSNEQKSDVAHFGRVGFVEDSLIFELPQRFDDTDITKYLVANDKILLMPQVGDKFVKFVNSGETEINEVDTAGEANGNMADYKKFEVQRAFGVGTILSFYFGEWTLTA